MDIHSLLDTYRGARTRRHREALQLFRKIVIADEDFAEIYRLLKRDRSKLARSFLLELRTRLKRRRDLDWKRWFSFCQDHGLCSWIGRYAYHRFKQSLQQNAAFERWHERWLYVTTRPHRYFKDQFLSGPPTLLRYLLDGLIRHARTLRHWAIIYDAPTVYAYRNHPCYPLGADKIRQRAWFEIRDRLL